MELKLVSMGTYCNKMCQILSVLYDFVLFIAKLVLLFGFFVVLYDETELLLCPNLTRRRTRLRRFANRLRIWSHAILK